MAVILYFQLSPVLYLPSHVVDRFSIPYSLKLLSLGSNYCLSVSIIIESNKQTVSITLLVFFFSIHFLHNVLHKSSISCKVSSKYRKTCKNSSLIKTGLFIYTWKKVERKKCEGVIRVLIARQNIASYR